MKSITKRNQLTPEESAERERLEGVIRKGIKSFLEVGNALIDISDKRLYRNTHSTFKEYVESEWELSARRAYQLCEAAEVVKLLPENVNHGSQINERQARELAKVPKKKRAKVLQMATVKAEANCRPVTAKLIQQAAEAVSKPKAPPVVIADPEPAAEIDHDGAIKAFELEIKQSVAAIPQGAPLGKFAMVLRVQAHQLEETTRRQMTPAASRLSAYTR